MYAFSSHLVLCVAKNVFQWWIYAYVPDSNNSQVVFDSGSIPHGPGGTMSNDTIRIHCSITPSSMHSCSGVSDRR